MKNTYIWIWFDLSTYFDVNINIAAMCMSYIYCDQLTTYLTYPSIMYIECMCVE